MKLTKKQSEEKAYKEYIEKMNPEKNSHKIGDAFRDDKGNLIRVVDGKEIKQIEEKTQRDIDLNRNINLWRMRNK